MYKLLTTALFASIGISVFMFHQNVSMQQKISIPIAYAQTAETIPAGTVVAFDLAACPSGWSEFTQARGRTIVGTNPTAGGGISVRTLGQIGGAETHTLTTAEMPVHAHTARQPYRLNNGTTVGIDGDNVVGGGNGAYGGAPNLYNALPPFTTGTSGSGGAHNNMQPFIALLYCEKN